MKLKPSTVALVCLALSAPTITPVAHGHGPATHGSRGRSDREHREAVQRFIGSWKVTESATTSACQDSFLLEHPDPSTVSLFHLELGQNSDLTSHDGDCSFTWYVQDDELLAQAGQACIQHLPDGSVVEVGLIDAHGTLQPDGSAKDSIFVSVTLNPTEREPRTCLVTIQETLIKTTPTSAPGKPRPRDQPKYCRGMRR